MTYKDVTRNDWVKVLLKIALPILERSANGNLKKEMPKGTFFKEDQYLEALGRIICGIAPWKHPAASDDLHWGYSRRFSWRAAAVQTPHA